LSADECIVQLKSKSISNINCCDTFSNTPLHLAAMNGRKQVIVVLLQAGADATLHNARSITGVSLVLGVYFLFFWLVFTLFVWSVIS